MRIRRQVNAVGAIVAAVCLASCASVGTPIAQQNISQIKPRVTTEVDLVRMFGPPSTKTLDTNGKTLLGWLYSAAQAKPATFVPVVGAFAGGTDVQVQQLSVLMNKNGTVERYTMNNSNPNVEMGTPRQTQ
jgi:outer membrane protein assembly factor BamE (lipoprotein component of BamABCDE complex)